MYRATGLARARCLCFRSLLHTVPVARRRGVIAAVPLMPLRTLPRHPLTTVRSSSYVLLWCAVHQLEPANHSIIHRTHSRQSACLPACLPAWLVAIDSVHTYRHACMCRENSSLSLLCLVVRASMSLCSSVREFVVCVCVRAYSLHSACVGRGRDFRCARQASRGDVREGNTGAHGAYVPSSLWFLSQSRLCVEASRCSVLRVRHTCRFDLKTGERTTDFCITLYIL